MNTESGLFFQDDGTPVPEAALPLMSTEEDFENFLVEHGLPGENLPPVMKALDDFNDRQATAKTADMIRHMLSGLEGTAAAVALRRVALGPGPDSLRDEAARLDVSHQAILDHEERIRERLGLPPGA